MRRASVAILLLLAVAGLGVYLRSRSHLKATPLAEQVPTTIRGIPTDQTSVQDRSPASSQESKPAPADLAASSPLVPLDHEASLKAGIFPYTTSATLGTAVNFENEIDTHSCFPLLVSGQIVTWLYRAYSADGELLVQRCVEDEEPFHTPGTRGGGVSDRWDRVLLRADPTQWGFTPIEAPDWGPFANPGFCGRFVAHWGFRGKVVVAYAYDIKSRRIAASQSLGPSNLETDNSAVMPRPEWSESCSGASFDPQPIGKAAFQLQEKRLSPEGRKLTDALVELQKSPGDPAAQERYLKAFPNDFKTFLELFDLDRELYDGHEYINVLPSLAKNHEVELGILLVQLSKGAHRDADAPNHLQHVAAAYAGQYTKTFVSSIKELSPTERANLITFLADVENHGAYIEYQDIIDGLKSIGQDGLAKEFEVARQKRTRQPHG